MRSASNAIPRFKQPYCTLEESLGFLNTYEIVLKVVNEF